MLDGDILKDHEVQSTLIQSFETPRTMFIALFNDAAQIYIINIRMLENINTIRFYKDVISRLGKDYVEGGL